MTPPHRAIIAITSAHADLFEGGGHTTGLFISEALHPFNVFKKAGFEVDFVSVTGKYFPDWLSQQPDFLPPADRAQWEDLSGELRQKLDHQLYTPDQIDASKYGIFFASAGHAALIDYPKAVGIQKIAEQIWNAGGIVSAVCHGPAIFDNLIDHSTGKPLIQGKQITGFTTEAEYDMKIMDTLKSWGNPLVEETAESMGAKYSRGAGVWDDYSIVDGRLVTGQNPQSARSTAVKVVEAFEKL
ncbi:class I glutamine amidotransferase-like protein [Rhizodiscina lignyota]|uniref:D-lactate dehydratase n=1 Tax=Rhizodiscina lignyota TaxID=1504668 RepID=A0A9P4IB70_9PEZI|nr:class I glutamine amidotransferase-like protein [Rhizodiscina lignyota]